MMMRWDDEKREGKWVSIVSPLDSHPKPTYFYTNSNNRRIDEKRKSVEWNFLFLISLSLSLARIFFFFIQISHLAHPIDVKQYTLLCVYCCWQGGIYMCGANFDMKNHFACLIWLSVVNFRRHIYECVHVSGEGGEMKFIVVR